jgi:hypothetical protein
MKIGHKNGKLTTVEKLGGRPCVWLCKCDCGNERKVKDVHLYSLKGIKSCGCEKIKDTKEFIKKRVFCNENGCWEWQGAKHKQGYGNVRYSGKTWLAHRLSWKIFNGEIPVNAKVCHKCDVMSCCNPNHLFLGTQKDNVDDAIKKQRFKPGKLPRQLKLTWDQVQEIKKLNSEGITRKKLQEKFEVSRTCIAKILTAKSWNINWTKEV